MENHPSVGTWPACVGVVSDRPCDVAVERTIQVDSRFMLWTMDKMDRADRVPKEMGVK